MKIIFYDGSEMECNEIIVSSPEFVIVDGVRYVPLIEILRIES